jgi:hypothetical protein
MVRIILHDAKFSFLFFLPLVDHLIEKPMPDRTTKIGSDVRLYFLDLAGASRNITPLADKAPVKRRRGDTAQVVPT